MKDNYGVVIYVPDNIERERWNICMKCEYFEEETKRCEKCLCYLPDKILAPPANCPIYKWLHHTIENEVY